MNPSYRRSLDAVMNSLGRDGFDERIFLILEGLLPEQDDADRKHPVNVEARLNDLRDRYESGERFGGSMNLYPSDKKGSCQSFCLAIASKKFDKPRKGMESGFRGIMLEMAAYWFSCLSVNKETLILTSTWDNAVFEESYKKIIDNYTRVHNKRVYIIEVGPTGFFLRYPY